MNNKNFVIFDLETTGLKVGEGARVIEMCAVKLSPELEEIDRIDTLVNPDCPIPEFITKITNINDEMVKDKPKIDVVFKDFIKLISDGSTISAYNSRFDMSFMYHHAKEFKMYIDNPVVDLLAIAHAVVPVAPNHKLDTIRNLIGVNAMTMHRAAADVFVCIELWKKWIPENSVERAIHLTKTYNPFAK